MSLRWGRRRKSDVRPKVSKRRRWRRRSVEAPSASIPFSSSGLEDPSTAAWQSVITPQQYGNLEGLAPARVSEIFGPLTIPQIVVGRPSYYAEPVAVGADFCALPFRPATVIDGWSSDVMTVRAASLRGHLHCYNGAPRQDDVIVHRLPDGRVIVAVADGVSGATQSHIGASSATKFAVDWISSSLGPITADLDWSALIKNTAYGLSVRAQALFGLNEPDPVRAEEELATTLVCAVVEPVERGLLRAHLVAVGDSSAWLLSSSGQFTTVLGGKTASDDGIASAAVTGLPRVPPEITPTVVDFAPGDVLLVGTDGIGDPLGDGQGGVGNLLRGVLAGPSFPSLIEFAHAVDFSREMFDDDRTLVAVWPRPSANGTPMSLNRRPVE